MKKGEDVVSFNSYHKFFSNNLESVDFCRYLLKNIHHLETEIGHQTELALESMFDEKWINETRFKKLSDIIN